MKTKQFTLRKWLAVMLACSPFATEVNAQFLPSSIPTNIPSAVFQNVVNTGNSIVDFAPTGTQLQVSCWDGDYPHFSFRDVFTGANGGLPIEGTNYGTVYDPDIVADPGGSGTFVIVYVLNGQIAIEAWEFTGAGCILKMTPTIISGGGACNGPNIDQTELFHMGISWQENNTIYAAYYDYFSGTIGPAVDFSSCYGWPNKGSDVSVYQDAAGNEVINVVFVNERPWGHELVIQREDLGALAVGTPPFCGYPETQKIASGSFAAMQEIRRPRIASPPPNTGYHLFDCQIVFEYPDYASGQYFIGGVNHTAFSSGLNNYVLTPNLTPTITGFGSYVIRPVVSYNKCQEIFVELETDAPAATGFPGISIVGTILDWQGNPNPSFPNHPIINPILARQHTAPSVSGRYVTKTMSGWSENYSTYFDRAFQEIHTKTSPCGTGNPTRKAPVLSEKDDMKLYPNPAGSQVKLEFNLSDESAVVNIQVLDMQGKSLKDWSPSGMNEGNNQIVLDISDLPNGTYLVRLQAADNVQISKLTKLE